MLFRSGQLLPVTTKSSSHLPADSVRMTGRVAAWFHPSELEPTSGSVLHCQMVAHTSSEASMTPNVHCFIWYAVSFVSGFILYDQCIVKCLLVKNLVPFVCLLGAPLHLQDKTLLERLFNVRDFLM